MVQLIMKVTHGTMVYCMVMVDSQYSTSLLYKQSKDLGFLQFNHSQDGLANLFIFNPENQKKQKEMWWTNNF